MPNNPFINQMNIQGDLYDLWDQRWTPDSHNNISFTAPSSVSIVAPETVYIGTGTDQGITIWDDGSISTDSDAVSIAGENVATQPWVLQQLQGISVDNVLTLKGSVSSAGGMATIYNAGANTGDTYVVTAPFAWGNNPRHIVEVGDLFVCTEGYSAGSGSSANWAVVQGNIIGNGVSHYRGTMVDWEDLEEVDMAAGDFWYVFSGGIISETYPAGSGTIALCIQDWHPEGSGDMPVDPEDPYSSQYVKLVGPEDRAEKQLIAGTGLSLSSTWSTITFNHANSITAGAFGPSASASALSFALPYVQYDAQGHISSVASFAHTIPTFAPATSSSAGQAGVLPAMSSMTSEQETWVLYANGTWGPQLGSGDEGYTLPLAADGTRGGLQIGYATDRTSGYFAVQLQSEKAYVAIPTFTGATSQADGDVGLVPQAMASASQTFLRADGAWADVAYVSSNILYM